MNPMVDPYVLGSFRRSKSELNSITEHHQWKIVVCLLQSKQTNNSHLLLAFGDSLEESEKQILSDAANIHDTVAANYTQFDPRSNATNSESRFPGGGFAVPVIFDARFTSDALTRPVQGVVLFSSSLIAPARIISDFDLLIVSRKLAHFLVKVVRDFLDIDSKTLDKRFVEFILLPNLLNHPVIDLNSKDALTLKDSTGETWSTFQTGRMAKVKSLRQLESYRQRVIKSTAYLKSL